MNTEPTGPTPPAAPRRPLRRDAVRNREKVLDAAFTAFQEIGPDASMEQIARLADVSPATLYRRFPSKDAIVTNLVEAFYDKLTTLAGEAQQMPPAQGLSHFLHTVGWHIAASRAFLPRAWGELAAPDQVRHLRTVTEDLLTAAQRAGEVNENVTVGDIAAIVWALRGIIDTTGHTLDSAWQRHLAVALAGLGTRDLHLAQPPMNTEQINRVTGGDAQT